MLHALILLIVRHVILQNSERLMLLMSDVLVLINITTMVQINCVKHAVTNAKHVPMPLNVLLVMQQNSESLLLFSALACKSIMIQGSIARHVKPAITHVQHVQMTLNAPHVKVQTTIEHSTHRANCANVMTSFTMMVQINNA